MLTFDYDEVGSGCVELGTPAGPVQVRFDGISNFEARYEQIKQVLEAQRLWGIAYWLSAPGRAVVEVGFEDGFKLTFSAGRISLERPPQ